MQSTADPCAFADRLAFRCMWLVSGTSTSSSGCRTPAASMHRPVRPTNCRRTSWRRSTRPTPRSFENPDTGLTTVRLGFALSRWEGRSIDRTFSDQSDSVSSARPTLDLAGPLRYLWNRAELNRWQPGFAGKRNWSVVRRRLLSAAAIFDRARRVAADIGSSCRSPSRSNDATRSATDVRRNSLVPRHAPAGLDDSCSLRRSQGVGAVAAWLPRDHQARPDQPFAFDERPYTPVGEGFQQVLSLWGADDGIHLMMLATFGLNAAGVPHRSDHFDASRRHWIPVRDTFEGLLVRSWFMNGAGSSRSWRPLLSSHDDEPSVALTDTGEEPVLLHIAFDSLPIHPAKRRPGGDHF